MYRKQIWIRNEYFIRAEYESKQLSFLLSTKKNFCFDIILIQTTVKYNIIINKHRQTTPTNANAIVTLHTHHILYTVREKLVFKNDSTLYYITTQSMTIN